MYTISEVCKKTGLTAHTLRFYEKEKLLPDIKRSVGGFRQYTEDDMEALNMICCLKNTGMSLQDIAEFMALSREGDKTLRERCKMLEKHRKTVIEQMEEVKRHLEKVNSKYSFFSNKLKEYEDKEAQSE